MFNLQDDITDEELLLIMQARTTISAALDRSKILDAVREIVDASTVLNFKSSRARKFISASRPELLLEMDMAVFENKYPDQFKKFRAELAKCPKQDLENTVDSDGNQPHQSIINARAIKEEVVRSEISNEILNFFTAVFKYIITGEIAKGFENQTARVESITANLDRVELRNTVQGILVSDNDKRNGTHVSQVSDDELGFIFSIVSSVSFGGGGSVFTDDSVYVEVIY